MRDARFAASHRPPMLLLGVLEVWRGLLGYQVKLTPLAAD
jgi:hypothetical protein